MALVELWLTITYGPSRKQELVTDTKLALGSYHVVRDLRRLKISAPDAGNIHIHRNGKVKVGWITRESEVCACNCAWRATLMTVFKLELIHCDQVNDHSNIIHETRIKYVCTS
jgi:hypothetical protein